MSRYIDRSTNEICDVDLEYELRSRPDGSAMQLGYELAERSIREGTNLRISVNPERNTVEVIGRDNRTATERDAQFPPGSLRAALEVHRADGVWRFMKRLTCDQQAAVIDEWMARHPAERDWHRAQPTASELKEIVDDLKAGEA